MLVGCSAFGCLVFDELERLSEDEPVKTTMRKILPVSQNGLKWALILCVLGGVPAVGSDVPAVLPRPDNSPPSSGKVKVYILAGQSNMVGFGYLQGSRPVYPSIYLSADPNIKVGRMPVGPSALLRHGVYQGPERDAPSGARVAIYQGAYQEGVDYSSMKPVRETTVALGTVSHPVAGRRWAAHPGGPGLY